jgi:hypothetical protein
LAAKVEVVVIVAHTIKAQRVRLDCFHTQLTFSSIGHADSVCLISRREIAFFHLHPISVVRPVRKSLSFAEFLFG